MYASSFTSKFLYFSSYLINTFRCKLNKSIYSLRDSMDSSCSCFIQKKNGTTGRSEELLWVQQSDILAEKCLLRQFPSVCWKIPSCIKHLDYVRPDKSATASSPSHLISICDSWKYWEFRIMSNWAIWVLSAKKPKRWCCTVFQSQERQHLKDYFPSQEQCTQCKVVILALMTKTNAPLGWNWRLAMKRDQSSLSTVKGEMLLVAKECRQLFIIFGSSRENTTKIGRQVSRNFITKKHNYCCHHRTLRSRRISSGNPDHW